MAFIQYPKFKILLDPKSKKQQGLKTGDIVRRQYIDNPNLIYSLMTVIETGIDVIAGEDSPYFIGALLEGDEPASGELLDFVRVTNLFDSDRSGALYMTASDSKAPFMDVIDGLAYEKSFCYPVGLGIDTEKPSSFYNYLSAEYVEAKYNDATNEACRIIRLTRSNVSGNKILGIKQTLRHVPEHPGRLLVSFKIRASKSSNKNNVKFAFTDSSQTEGLENIDINTKWKYIFLVLNIEYPAHYSRSLTIETTNCLQKEGDWCEIADLNIIDLSSVSNFGESSKVRVGKIKGIVDPIFGVLEGYGAYFQNIYATKNVNIAGTLTAGDDNGFSSTFYVGKIHKNIVQNSIDCEYLGNIKQLEELSPTGIGKVFSIHKEGSIIVQSEEWANSHHNKEYCFSFWAKSDITQSVKVYQNRLFIKEISIDSKDWKRYHVSFLITGKIWQKLCFDFENSGNQYLISSPQLEAGKTPSQYQPTDGTLSFVEDYGAWFNKGGIGGTIQNPLLRLNENGSISSRNNSFVINPDGTGYFASGKFTWDKNAITLKDVVIKWEDFDDQAKEMMYPITLEIKSNSGYLIKNNNNDVDARAVLYRNGNEIDINGTKYTYNWTLWNDSGTKPVLTYKGKSIQIYRTNVTNKGVLTCEVEE